MKLILKCGLLILGLISCEKASGQSHSLWNSESAYQKNYAQGLAGDSPLCGIYEYVSPDGGQYTLGLVNSGSEFRCYALTQTSAVWYGGRLKATLKETSENVFIVDWTMGDGKITKRGLASWENGTFEMAGLGSSPSWLLKTWPSVKESLPIIDDNNAIWLGTGSGVLINPMGFVMTNQHVVDGAKSVSVVIGNAGQQVEYEAGVVGADADVDLALLKITDVAFAGVAAPPFSFQTKVSVGEEVFALGYPMALSGLGAEMKYTNGSVSANSGFNGDMKTMQISVPIQSGNSGGPLFNAQGELIGLTNAKIRSDLADNVSYAIKSIFVQAFLGSMPYQVSPPNGAVELENRVDIVEALRPYTCLVLVK